MKRRYKSARKYRCPFCDKTATRDKLAVHIEDKHESMIPEGYTGARILYDHINRKNYGTCLICKKPVYEWDPNVSRYKNLCGDPKCLEAIKNRARNNHLEDPEVQKKMLAGRRISGYYTFTDGTTHSYVGSYEKNCFEFMDTILNIPGKDIMSPGPTIWYEYEGEKHPWILDWMYIPVLLCCDVKDGGNNPNNRPMEDYRAKQIAKEEAISKTDYNYIRLTDNNFGQLLSALADIRMGAVNHDPNNHIYINEAVGGMVGMKQGHDYIIPRMMGGLTFRYDDEDQTRMYSSMYFGNTEFDGLVSFSSETMQPVLERKKDLSMIIGAAPVLHLKTNKIPSMLKDFPNYDEQSLLEELLGHAYEGLYSLISEKVVSVTQDPDNEIVRTLVLNGIVNNVKTVMVENTHDFKTGNLIHMDGMTVDVIDAFVRNVDNVSIYVDQEGYYCTTPTDFRLVSPHFPNEVDIPDTLIDLMNQMYKNKKLEEGLPHAVPAT